MRSSLFGLIFLLSALPQAYCMLASVPPAAAADKIEFAIALHGGAGLEPDKLTTARQQEYRESLAKALEVGRKILAGGGTAIDAVEETIRTLEDDPLYNAGRGAVFNSEGGHELDASIMDGRTGEAGAVASVTTVKNPISLARLVMSETPHVLLVGQGAEKFADEMRGRPRIERVPNSYFGTPERKSEWLRAVEKEQHREATGEPPHKGTVGCAALDKQGNLAAGTSTGGLTNKKWGRVGDSPIIGAGTYASNATCAVSCTGTGELFIKHSVAFHVSALMAYKGMPLAEATREIMEKVLPADAGGLIAIDTQGHIAMPFNTKGMSRAATDSTGRVEIGLGK
jgi:beta-aspartyl-peptidase (threonine type)